MQRLHQVYCVYEAHAKNVESFSLILWADLDVQIMTDATEEVCGRLKKVNRLADMPVYNSVCKSIEGFLSSLPLMKELKSPALRTRHWNKLMEVWDQRLLRVVD